MPNPPMAFPKRFQAATGWIAILSLFLLTGFCLIAHLGSFLRYAFPGGCFLVGAFLYRQHPVLYVGFTWWIWFTAALLRRLVDVQAGWLDPNPVLLAPFAVTIVCLITLLRQIPKAIYGQGLPFVLCAVGIFYGTTIGLMSGSPRAIVVPLLNWLTPLGFGYYLFSQWRQFSVLRQVTQQAFLWGTLLMGGYGVAQFFLAPPWDRFWLEHLTIQTFGTPQPLGIRVFSTMQSPQPFACTIMAGVLLLFSTRSSLHIPAAIGGYLAGLLSLARSAWLGWGIGALVLLSSLKPKVQMRLITGLLILAVAAIPIAVLLPATTLAPLTGTIGSRLQTLLAGSADVSFLDRTQAYNHLLSAALGQVTGQGLGYTLDGATIASQSSAQGSNLSSNLGSNDSGILTLLFTLGWIGLFPYLSGLVLLLIQVLQPQMPQNPDPTDQNFLRAAQAIVVATIVQIPLNNVMLSTFGMVLWSFIGLAMAAQQQARSLSSPHLIKVPNPTVGSAAGSPES